MEKLAVPIMNHYRGSWYVLLVVSMCCSEFVYYRNYKWECIFNQASTGPTCVPVFWNCFGSHVNMSVFVCLSVCPPPRTLITSGMIWCDIDRVWLVKQAYGFPCFQLLIITLAIDKMDGCGLINTACRERLPKKTKVMRYYVATEGLPERCSASFIKVSRGLRSNTFKRKLAFGFTVIILAF